MLFSVMYELNDIPTPTGQLSFHCSFASSAKSALCVWSWLKNNSTPKCVSEETTLLEEKAECRYNNPRHCHDDGQPDFRDRHSGFISQDDPEMWRWYKGSLQPDLWALDTNNQRREPTVVLPKTRKEKWRVREENSWTDEVPGGIGWTYPETNLMSCQEYCRVLLKHAVYFLTILSHKC